MKGTKMQSLKNLDKLKKTGLLVGAGVVVAGVIAYAVYKLTSNTNNKDEK